ncbi:cupin domain-containing protein [uncultured Psychrobacter sp.]|uniref:cupin domain-containing protein n=1 Tax=uncultured Psychrobacter sp. TaxID=259303 RepID=UPI00345B2936
MNTETATKNVNTSKRPEGSSLEDWISTRVARFEDRQYDFSALKFQADYDPKYRRAQMRYMGTGATGVSGDSNTVQAENFTFSTMLLPAGCEGPPHVHTDAEEVFFMLRGSITLTVEDQGEETSMELNYRDLISVPPGVYRGLHNHTQEDALMCVMIGNPKPVIPTYPDDHPLSKIKR